MLIQALAHSHVTILGALYDGINKLGKSRLSITSEEPGAKPDLWSEDFILIRGDYPEMKTLNKEVHFFSFLVFTFQMDA